MTGMSLPVFPTDYSEKNVIPYLGLINENRPAV
jgi:hypothetical protein